MRLRMSFWRLILLKVIGICNPYSSEQEILREEIKSLNAVKSRLKLRITELEDEVKKVKEEFEKNAKANKSDDEVRFLFYSHIPKQS